ncbi:AMP-dependent synthetase, partial [Nostoc sp. FACHB-110]|nr:AMP-dependent synthetase [Nostoc sp. FACHB-110]
MQSNNNSQFLVFSSETKLFYREIEIAIRSSLTVDDCVVIKKQTPNYKQELVAYIVPSSVFALEQLLSHLQIILPSELIPTAFVPISSIPLTASGQVDAATLVSLEVIDFDVSDRLEKKLESFPAIERVAVVVEPRHNKILPVHLEDLLGENQG